VRVRVLVNVQLLVLNLLKCMIQLGTIHAMGGFRACFSLRRLGNECPSTMNIITQVLCSVESIFTPLRPE
jgi:hypothetical protein